MMHEDRSGVARMLANYRDVIRSFVVGEIPANVFETDFLVRFKNDPHQVVSAEFDILDELFANVDDYVEEPTLRAQTDSISGDELRERARIAYARLYDEFL